MTVLLCRDRMDIDEELIKVPTRGLVAQSPPGGHPLSSDDEPEPAEQDEQEGKKSRRVKKKKEGKTTVISGEVCHKTKKKVLQNSGVDHAATVDRGTKDASSKYRISANRNKTIAIDKIQGSGAGQDAQQVSPPASSTPRAASWVQAAGAARVR